jgi:hypothetical protein
MAEYLRLNIATFAAASRGEAIPAADRTRRQRLGQRIYVTKLAPFPQSVKDCPVVFNPL